MKGRYKAYRKASKTPPRASAPVDSQTRYIATKSHDSLFVEPSPPDRGILKKNGLIGVFAKPISLPKESLVELIREG
jgi:hypothetical protein